MVRPTGTRSAAKDRNLKSLTPFCGGWGFFFLFQKLNTNKKHTIKSGEKFLNLTIDRNENNAYTVLIE